MMKHRKVWLLGQAYLETERATVREFLTSEAFLGLGTAAFPEVIGTMEAIFEGGYDEAVLVWGIGSGKSFLASAAVSYVVHSLLCLRDPQGSLGMAKGSNITVLIMAPSARQARDIVFAGARRQMQGSPWFGAHAPSACYLAEEIRLPKNITVMAGNSSSSFALGHNVLGAVVDEAAWFPVTEGGRSERIEDIYHALRGRITSRFGYRGLLVLISSPRTVGDFLDRRLREAKCEPRTFASQKAVWEVRPGDLLSGRTFEWEGLAIPIEYERDFRLNPCRALRDLAARPTAAVHPFLSDGLVLEGAVDERRRAPLDRLGRLHAWFRPNNDLPRYIHIDLGLTRDACGLAMAYCEPAEGAADKPRVVVELMQRLAAERGGEVELARPREIVLSLRNRGFNIAQVSYDGWQSADSKQILRRRGIRTKTVSVDRTPEAYETLKELLLDGRLCMYRYEPFMEEVRRLEIVPGGKVDHPAGGSKDVADAVAGAVREAVRHWQAKEVRAHLL